jgi:hypothetical protein
MNCFPRGVKDLDTPLRYLFDGHAVIQLTDANAIQAMLALAFAAM